MTIKTNKFLTKNIFRKIKIVYSFNIFIVLLLLLSSFFCISCFVFATEEKIIKHVAISYFENKIEKPDWNWLSKGLSDRLISRLSQYSALSLLSRKDIEEYYINNQLIPSQTDLKKDDLLRLQESYDVDVIFFGSFYQPSSSRIAVSLKKFDQSTDQITSFRDFRVEVTSIMDLEDEISSFILQELNIELNEINKSIDKQLTTSSVDALASYYRSLDYKDRAIIEYKGADFPSKELWAKAIENGENAVKEDPDFADAYFLLAEIYNKTRWTIKEANSLNRFIELVKIHHLESKDIYEKASQAYFRLGYSFYSKKDFEKAIEYFKYAIKYNPDLLEPHQYLAQLYYEMGEIGLSLNESKEVLRINPQNKDISWLMKKTEQSQRYGREAYEYYEKGYLFYKEENYKAAIENLQQSIAYNSGFKESHYYLALVYYILAEFDLAIEQWNRTIELDPFDNSAKHYLNRTLEEKKYGRDTLKYFNTGYDYYLNGEYQKAIESFNQSLEANPEFEKARKFLSRSYYQLNQMDKYREERAKVTSSEFFNEEMKAEEYYKLGYEFYSLNNFQVAIEELNKALDLIKDYPAARYLLAEIFFQQNEYVKAREQYDKIVSGSEKNEYSDDALYGSGWSNYLLEDYGKAAEMFSKLINEFPESNLFIQAKYKLGKALFKTEKYSEVVSIYKDFIKTYPQFQGNEIREIYYLLGQANLWIPDLGEAERIFNELILLYPDFEMISQTKYYLSLSLFKQEKYDEAISCLKDLITVEDVTRQQKNDINYLLARCYLNTGDYDQSIQIIEKLKKIENIGILSERISFDLGLAYLLKEDKERALLEFQAFIEAYPQSDLLESAHFEAGKILYDLKKYELAISELEGINSIESLYLIAKSFEQLGNDEKKIIAYNELKDRFPDSDVSQEAYFKLGTEYYKKNMYEEALMEFSKMVEVFPESPFAMESNYWIGWSNFKLANYSKAKDYFARVDFMEVEPDIARKSHFMTAEALYKLKEFPLAREKYKDYIRQYPESEVTVNAQYAIAWTYLETNDLQSAVIEFEKIVNLYPESDYVEEAKFRIIKSKLQLGEVENMEFEIEKFIDQYPESSFEAEAYYLLTQVYLQSEKWMDSILWSERAIREKPDNPYLPEIMYGLCISYFKKDEYERSIKIGEIYLEKYPNKSFSDDVLYIAGTCWEQLENIENAINSYQTLIKNYPDSSYMEKTRERLKILKPEK